jgi:putative component of toxin-antitoxin plasmid stabilization module
VSALTIRDGTWTVNMNKATGTIRRRVACMLQAGYLGEGKPVGDNVFEHRVIGDGAAYDKGCRLDNGEEA